MVMNGHLGGNSSSSNHNGTDVMAVTPTLSHFNAGNAERGTATSGHPSNNGHYNPAKMAFDERPRRDHEDDDDNHGFESPLKAMKVNFRMNQMFGIFPYSISEDFLVFKFQPFILLWAFVLKFALIALFLFLIYVWLQDYGYDFSDFWNRAFGHDYFSRTDYFAIIAHYLFLQTSALFIYFVNLKMGNELSKLNLTLKRLALTIKEKETKAIPSAKKMMTYRYFVCILCTLASILYLCGIHKIVKNPEGTNFLDGLIVFVIALALYIENQNHMFTELLFLRFLTILKHHFIYTLIHLEGPHPKGVNRTCCYDRCRTLHQMFKAINRTFGNDLLITTTILVISIAFGIYLALAFLVFIGEHQEHILFIIAYLLYAIIPSLRLFVIVEGSESIRDEIKSLRAQLNVIKADILCSESLETANRSSTYVNGRLTPASARSASDAARGRCDLAQLRLVYKLFSDVTEGFSVKEFFNLNRGIITSLIGSLVTYLIVLLQFKVADMTDRELDAVRKITSTV